jgi:hypothetical protein
MGVDGIGFPLRPTGLQFDFSEMPRGEAVKADFRSIVEGKVSKEQAAELCGHAALNWSPTQYDSTDPAKYGFVQMLRQALPGYKARNEYQAAATAGALLDHLTQEQGHTLPSSARDNPVRSRVETSA